MFLFFLPACHVQEHQSTSLFTRRDNEENVPHGETEVIRLDTNTFHFHRSLRLLLSKNYIGDLVAFCSCEHAGSCRKLGKMEEMIGEWS